MITSVGKRFGQLVVIGNAPRRNTNAYRLCRCDCGKRTQVAITNLVAGTSRSCGCSKPKRHGMTKTKEWRAWKAMRRRCYDKKRCNYDQYGGRGIRVCARWRRSFTAFLADVGKAPSALHTLDRWPNGDGDYKPRNVRWATKYQQTHNRRKYTRRSA